MADATPRPWDISEQEWGDGPIFVLQYEHEDFTVSEIATVWGIDGHERPEMSLPGKANAELICRAVNAHDELLVALEGLLYFDKFPTWDEAEIYAHDVLARARGES